MDWMMYFLKNILPGHLPPRDILKIQLINQEEKKHGGEESNYLITKKSLKLL